MTGFGWNGFGMSKIRRRALIAFQIDGFDMIGRRESYDNAELNDRCYTDLDRRRATRCYCMYSYMLSKISSDDKSYRTKALQSYHYSLNPTALLPTFDMILIHQ